MTKRANSPRASADWLKSALGMTALLVASAVFYVPWLTGPCGPEPDAASDMVLHEAFAGKWDFARTIVWPFGPYGFLYSRSYHPATYVVTLMAWGLFGLTLSVVLWRFSHAFFRSTIIGLLWSGFLLFAGVLALDTVFLLLLLMVLIEGFYIEQPSGYVASFLSAVAGGLLALIKFPLFALGCFVFALVGLHDLFRRRRVPWRSAVFAGCLLLFWRLAGQRVMDLPRFVATRLMISMGYTGAMALIGPWLELIGYCALAALLLVMCGAYEKERKSAFMAVVGLAVFLFVVFKEGFVRHDDHAVIACAVLLGASILLAGALCGVRTSSRFRRAGTAHVLLSAALLWWSVKTHSGVGLPSQFVATLRSTDEHIAAAYRFFTQPGRLPAEYAAYAQEIRETYPLPPVEGTVDIYPHGQTALIHNGLHYDPRPIFQSYLTYTAALAELNAEHLRGDASPEYVFFHVWPIDMRYPSLDDSLSWPELLARYDAERCSDELLVLKRRPHPRTLRQREVRTLRTTFGSTIDVPSSLAAPVWTRIIVRQTILGRIAAFLFKSPWVYISAATDSNPDQRYTIVPALARGGFLLSPLVDSHVTFGDLFDAAKLEKTANQRVHTITLSVLDPGKLFFQPEIDVSYYYIEEVR